MDTFIQLSNSVTDQHPYPTNKLLLFYCTFEVYQPQIWSIRVRLCVCVCLYAYVCVYLHDN